MSKHDWGIKYPPLTDTTFSRDETGACVVHIAWHSDGEKLKLPLTKHNVLKAKMDALHESMKLYGNFSTLAHDALWKVLALPDSAFET